MDHCIAERAVNPETLEPEGRFRYQVRDILNLPWYFRDDQIYAELRRLRNVDERVTALAASVETPL